MTADLSGEAVKVWVPELPQSLPDLFPVLIIMMMMMTRMMMVIMMMTRLMMMRMRVNFLKPHVLLKVSFSYVVSEGGKEVNKCLKYGDYNLLLIKYGKPVFTC